MECSWRSRFLIAGAAPLLLMACLAKKKPIPVPEPPKPVPFQLVLKASPGANPDEGGQPLSVVLRIYQLKGVGALAKLGFEQAASDRPDEELLAGEGLNRREVTVVPGESVTLDDKLAVDASHVAVVAFFRAPDPHFWRLVLPARTLKQAGKAEVQVEPCHLALASKDLELLPGQPAEYVPQCPKPVALADPASSGERELVPPKSQGGGLRPRTPGSTRRSRRSGL